MIAILAATGFALVLAGIGWLIAKGGELLEEAARAVGL